MPQVVAVVNTVLTGCELHCELRLPLAVAFICVKYILQQ
jgi:hypothetical protein